ncbi:hypothetical protein PAECIP112173_02330 [Paenibacillus sp. JJ-100]|uniref:hypothetical protein n=1 Tax=Paenibacillus sp. JJ-100 TaxID=2974896 RepID=UPI0022FF7C20|nr:hypothetical protein [Paenibacillus sp. JJ-100]CAI6074475.1 hypothetical protein PAECIP112173_02330 [Paenibacillus sp. JJ-100]
MLQLEHIGKEGLFSAAISIVILLSIRIAAKIFSGKDIKKTYRIINKYLKDIISENMLGKKKDIPKYYEAYSILKKQSPNKFEYTHIELLEKRNLNSFTTFPDIIGQYSIPISLILATTTSLVPISVGMYNSSKDVEYIKTSLTMINNLILFALRLIFIIYTFHQAKKILEKEHRKIDNIISLHLTIIERVLKKSD